MSLFPVTRMSILNPVSEFDRVFDTLLNASTRASMIAGPASAYDDMHMPTIPRANILENKEGYSIELAVPGFSRGDFNISVDDNVLTINDLSASSKDLLNLKHISRVPAESVSGRICCWSWR